MASAAEGGVNIEEVAKNSPEKTHHKRSGWYK